MTTTISLALIIVGIIIAAAAVFGLTIFFCSVNTRTDCMKDIKQYDDEDPIDGYVDYYFFEEEVDTDEDDNFNVE